MEMITQRATRDASKTSSRMLNKAMRFFTRASESRRARHGLKRNGNLVMQGMWVGPRLSAMERLSIASFLANGHAYHLFTYGDVEGVPDGTLVLDANEILPRDMVFQYGPAAGRGEGSFAGFANYFRYKMLLDRGGWWVDTDTICLKPFDFERQHLIMQQLSSEGLPEAANGVMKMPRGSAFAQQCWDECRMRNPKEIVWGETGPRMAARVARELGLEAALAGPNEFAPINWNRVMRLVNKGGKIERHWRSIHLCNEMWRRRGLDKDATYPASSIYEQLKRRFL